MLREVVTWLIEAACACVCLTLFRSGDAGERVGCAQPADAADEIGGAYISPCCFDSFNNTMTMTSLTCVSPAS